MIVLQTESSFFPTYGSGKELEVILVAGSLRPQTHPLAFTADHTRLGALSVLLWHLYKSPCHLLFFCILSVFISGNLLVSYVSPLQSPYCFWEEVFRRCGINNNVFLFCLLYHQPGLPSPLFISSLSDAFFFFLLETWVTNEFIHGSQCGTSYGPFFSCPMQTFLILELKEHPWKQNWVLPIVWCQGHSSLVPVVMMLCVRHWTDFHISLGFDVFSYQLGHNSSYPVQRIMYQQCFIS